MNPRPAILVSAIITLAGTGVIQAQQTQLNVGDFAFVQAGSDTDTIGFVPLVDIKAGTYIHITDNARTTSAINGTDWRVGATLNPGEGFFTWVAPADVAAGTVVSLTTAVGTHGIDLAVGGENLLAFQGTYRKPAFIGGVGFSSAGTWITTGAPTTNNSYLPSNLTLGTNAVDIGNFDNGAYNTASPGGSSGSAATMLAAINTATNWTTNDTSVPGAPPNFSISGSLSGTAMPERLLGFNFGYAAASYSNSPTVNLGDSLLSAMGYVGTGTFAATGTAGFASQGARIAGGHTTSATLDLGTAPYLSFTLTMDAGQQVDLTHVEFSSRRDANAPGKVALFASTNGFASSFQIGGDLDISAGTTWGTLNFDDGFASAFTGAMEFRVYSWGALGTGAGNWDVDEVWVNGTVTAVPEPASAVLMLGGIALLAGRRRRRV